MEVGSLDPGPAAGPENPASIRFTIPPQSVVRVVLTGGWPAKGLTVMDDRDQYPRRPMWMPWAMTSLAFVVVAFLSYALGTRHEVVVDDSVRHGWIGFPFFTFFLFFWIFGCFRRMWWGGGYYGRPWRYRRYRYYDDP